MRRIFKPITNIIFYDFKKLMVLELLIRLIGIAVIYPIFRLGFFFSLKLSGLKYISNKDLVYFLTKPSTILIVIFLIALYAVYVTLEIVYLIFLYDNANHQTKISYRDFFVEGFKKFLQTIKKYHIFVMIPALLFFLVFEFAQFAFLSSTLKIPIEILEEIQSLKYFNLFFIIGLILLIGFFLEFSFVIYSIVSKRISLKQGFKDSRMALKHNRVKILGRYFFFNFIANLLMILFYALIVLFISLFVKLFRGEEVVYGLIITSMYSVFFIIRIVFTSIMFPLNISIVSYKYYQVNPVLLDENKTIVTKSVKTKLKLLIKPAIIAFILIFSLNFISIIDSIKNTQNSFQVFKQEEIIAHRGASSHAPENTLASLDLAILQGSDAIEFDVRGSKDHIPIILHDETLYRTTNFPVGIKVSDLDYDFIKKYDAGSWFSEEFKDERVPTLEQVFQLVSGRTTVFLDLKTSDRIVEEEIYRLIMEYDMDKSIKIMSFDPDQLERFKKMDPDIETILLISVFYGNINSLIDNPNIDHFGLRITVIERHPNIINDMHASGKKVYAWVVDNEKSINIGIKADVDGFITKRPIEAREIAYSKNNKDGFKFFLQNLFK